MWTAGCSRWCGAARRAGPSKHSLFSSTASCSAHETIENYRQVKLQRHPLVHLSPLN